jgi:aromatic-L-amino-acid/L-tryptophan decarboxylase
LNNGLMSCSCLFVRNRLDLTKSLDITPIYLRNEYSQLDTVIDYRNWQFSLGRRFRSLKIWFVMRTYGLSGMKAIVRKHIALGNVFADLVRTRPDLFEIITKPAFCLTVLRIRNPESVANEETPTISGVAQPNDVSNALTKKVHEAVNARGEIFITLTAIAGINAIRVVSANPAASEEYVRRAFKAIVEAAEEILRSRETRPSA